MTRRAAIHGCLLAALLAWTGAMSQPGEAFAADPKTPATGTGTSWGDYTTVGKVIAEVRSSDGDSLKMRVYWNSVTQGKTNTGSRGRRPSLNGNHGRTAQNPLTIAKAAIAQAKSVKLKTEHHDYDVGFFPDTLVKGAPKAPGGATTQAGDLSPGTVIEAWLIRNKSIAAREARESDLKLRTVSVLGFNSNYKADNDDKKGKAPAAGTAK